TGAGGVGISVLRNAAAKFAAGATTFDKQYEVPQNTGIFAHWPSIALDSNDIVYLTWDTTTTDNSGNYVNSIELSTLDLKSATPAFSTPITIAHPGTTVLWPWVAVSSDPAGAGNAAVVWYQYARATNPDSGTGNVSVMERTVFGANTATPALQTAIDAVGTPIHSGGICQGGTLCVATGQDRRLGDFFTDAVDQNGCVLIPTGETSLTDPAAATSRPLYIQQTSGTSLTGQTCAIPTSGAFPEARWAPLILVAGVVGASGVLFTRRRRRRAVAA
ncbi:MAG: hypothetical protein M3019_11585, partial [Candidatus Dormibacteraeota bacterium]|nr:hypothetical protein [Candidatus Dormibacteraeota bacterium]